MKNNIPCEMIQDILPLYIEKLTGEVTNAQVEEHLAECEKCSKVLQGMRAYEEPAQEKASEEIREVEFLKKTRQKNRRNLVACFVVTFLVMLAGLFVTRYLIGEKGGAELVNADVEMVEGGVHISGSLIEYGKRVSKVETREEDGVLYVSFRLAKSFGENSYFEKTIETTNTVREVRFEDRTVWYEGVAISAITDEVFKTAHPYVGDMPANGRTSGALGISSHLGSFTNELQTGAEPYEWKIALNKMYDKTRAAYAKELMESYGSVLIAMTGNLQIVTFTYGVDGSEQEYTVTYAAACEKTGMDIKEAAEDIRKLQELMELTRLSTQPVANTYVTAQASDVLSVRVVNLSDNTFATIGMNYSAGTVNGTQTTMHANGTVIAVGEVSCMELMAMDFPEGVSGGKVFISLIVNEEAEGESYRTNTVEIPYELGAVYSVSLTGSAEEGYHITCK